jgi:hypothetical protein
MRRSTFNPVLRILIAVGSLVAPSLCIAQSSSERKEYSVEVHLAAGPSINIFIDRLVPPGKSKNTIGYLGLARLMWHPDHKLSVGLLTGRELIASERYTIEDSSGRYDISATLSSTPMMIDVAVNFGELEIGTGLGAFLMHSRLEDEGLSEGTRIELGSILHANYAFTISEDLTLRAQFAFSYHSYRGIYTLSPQIGLHYDVYTY